ncbi:MAG: hypothetical protein ACRD7E_08630 [Bryobacteraceae bacterium]
MTILSQKSGQVQCVLWVKSKIQFLEVRRSATGDNLSNFVQRDRPVAGLAGVARALAMRMLQCGGELQRFGSTGEDTV